MERRHKTLEDAQTFVTAQTEMGIKVHGPFQDMDTDEWVTYS